MSLTIDEPMYQVCFVLKCLNELKEAGLLYGGYIIDMERLNQIIEQGEKLNFNKPSAEQMSDIISNIQYDITNPERK